MTLDRLLARLAVPFIAAVTPLYGCSSDDSTPCMRDDQCASGRICEQGECKEYNSSTSPYQWTCESGAKMYVDLCCENVGLNCGSKSGFSTYQLLVGDCDSKDPKEEQRHLQFFYCVYPICKEKYLFNSPEMNEAKKKIKVCGDIYLD